MPRRSRLSPERPVPAGGFTLTELLIVMVIIGILLAFILTAAMDGVRRAEERATQALIIKLETGLDDRIQALIETRPDYNNAHLYMASVYNGSTYIRGLQRVNVIAQYDYIKAEVPDVFYYNPSNTDYPFNFAAPPFPGTQAVTSTHAPYILPLGNAMKDDGPDSPLTASPGWSSFGASNAADPNGTGIYGASYAAAAGLYKNIGYAPAGYDGVDNDGDGLVDESDEGTRPLDTNQVNLITKRLGNHQHKTARSEMLYALLVEGQGPLGSSFNRDDFTDREVQDTDNDGLPEFVDGWGEPLQFYRWPVYYHSDLQRGVPVNNEFNSAGGGVTVGNGVMNYPFTSVFDAREQNTLDPSQQLLAPSWWSRGYNTGTVGSVSYSVTTYPTTLNTTPLSPGAAAFSMFFHPLVEPMSRGVTTAQPGLFWDRGTNYLQRRAYFTKFLIISSGPDRELGIARLDTVANSFYPFTSGTGAAIVGANAAGLLLESQARKTSLNSTTDPYMRPTDANPTATTGNTLYESGQDDISNHNVQAPGGLVQ